MVHPTTAPCRVLVVDDDPVVRLIMTVNLEAEGMEVVAAPGGDDSFDEVLRLAPDIIVIDVSPPECDGLDTLRRLKGDPRTRHTPAVVLSARASDDEVREGWLAGADHYLTKPFDVDEIILFLHDLRHRAAPQEAGRSRS